MRIKVSGDIISKTDQNKTNYNHGIYSMFIAKLDEPLSSDIHNQNSKEYRLFTFSNVYIKDDKFHLYISGADYIILNFIKNIEKNNIENPIIRINTEFKDYSSIRKITILPRIYHD